MNHLHQNVARAVRIDRRRRHERVKRRADAKCARFARRHEAEIQLAAGQHARIGHGHARRRVAKLVRVDAQRSVARNVSRSPLRVQIDGVVG